MLVNEISLYFVMKILSCKAVRFSAATNGLLYAVHQNHFYTKSFNYNQTYVIMCFSLSVASYLSCRF